MALPLNQRFSGGTNLAPVTPGNSGMLGNSPFDAVLVGPGNTAQYSTTQSIHSLLAGQVATSASGKVAYWAWTTSLGGPQQQLWGRAYLFLTANPAVTDSVIQFRGLQGTAGGGIQVTTAGHLQLLNASGGIDLTFTSVLPLNQWVRVEFWASSGRTSFLEARYYSSPDSATATEDLVGVGTYGGTGGFAEVDIGWTNPNASQPVTYFDSLQVNGIGWPGPDHGAVFPSPLSGVPAFQLLAAFGAAGNSQQLTYADISAYLRNFTVARTQTRQQGPLYQFQGGTLSALLKNDSGDFDPDNLHGRFVSTTGLQVQTVKFMMAGAFTWTAPSNLVGTADVVCVAGGGGGGGPSSVSFVFNGGGGGAAEYAEEPTLAVTAGGTYSGTVGAAGAGGAPGAVGGNGGNTTFTGDSVTVTAHGGAGGNHGTTSGGGAQGTGGTGGTGSTNTIAHPGGAGGLAGGKQGFNGGGGGGGSSGGSGSAGNAGGDASLSYPGYGGRAVAGGGAGGGRGNETGFQPGGGGGGGWNKKSGAGAGTGWVIITYVVTVPAATTTEITGNVPVQLNAYWPNANGIFAHLFTGFTDGWADAGLNIPGYAQVTMTATDATKILALMFLPAIGGAGAGEDSGARITRILNAAGQTNINATPGDTSLQAEVMGDYALNRCQVTAETEAGEFYVDVDGSFFFRHRQGLLSDIRSQFPQAVFSDQPNGPGPSGSVVWWMFDNTTIGGLLDEAGAAILDEAGAAILDEGLTVQGWTGAQATLAPDTTWSYPPGGFSLLVTSTAAALTVGSWQASSPLVPVVPGEQHGAEATVYTQGANQVTKMSMQIDWHDAYGNLLSSSPATPAQALPSGQAAHLSLHGLRVPQGAFNACVTIVDAEGPASGTQFWVDYVLWDPALKYTQPGRANDTSTLANDVQFTRPGGTLQEAKSLTSIAANQGAVISYQRTDVMFNTDADALAGAQWVLSVSLQSEDRVETLEILPRGDPYGINPHVLLRQIGDKIRFIRHPPNVVTPMVRDLYIKGITISYDVSAATFTLTWQTQDTAKYGAYIVLDDPYAGRTDFAGLAY